MAKARDAHHTHTFAQPGSRWGPVHVHDMVLVKACSHWDSAEPEFPPMYSHSLAALRALSPRAPPGHATRPTAQPGAAGGRTHS